MSRESAVDHHYALSTIFEIMDVGARADLKADLLKDLDRQRQIRTGSGASGHFEQALDGIVAQIEHCFSGLTGVQGKAGNALTDNDWSMSIRSRVGIPGGTCEFDLPAYYAWQHGRRRPARGTQRWCQVCRLADGGLVTLVLKMLRRLARRRR